MRLFSLSLALPGIAAAYSQYTWEKTYPQSCECMETGVSSSNCELFRCTCTCDITAGVCDYGCCCDPDCSSDQISRFQELNICASEGYAPESTTLCYNTKELSKVNPHYPLSGKPTASNAVDQALCVEKKNLMSKEDYYIDYGTQASSVFGSSTGQKDYDYSSPSSTYTSLPDAYYDRGDFIPAFVTVSPLSGGGVYNYTDDRAGGTYIQVPGGGMWTLPRPDFTGVCNDNGRVRFEMNSESIGTTDGTDTTTSTTSSILTTSDTCNRAVETDPDMFKAQCENSFSMELLVNSLNIAKSADLLGSALSPSPGAANTVPVSLRSLLYQGQSSQEVVQLDPSQWSQAQCVTGYYRAGDRPFSQGDLWSLANLTDTWNNTAAYDYNNYNLSAWCTPFLNDLNVQVTSSWGSYNTSGLCLSAVKSIQYTVIHDATAKGTITQVLADVVLMDIFPNSNYNDNYFDQSFAIEFESSSTTKSSNDNGNVISRPRSGNPGYIVGKPVVFGKSNTNTSQYDGAAVKYNNNGIQLPLSAKVSKSSASSACPSSTSILTTPWNYESIAFGYDMSSGCSLSLTRDELKNLCCQGSSSCSAGASSFADSTGLPIFFNMSINEGYVGLYGNADPLDLDQWYQLSVSNAILNGKSWNDDLGTCSNMISGLHYKFLVAKSGEKYNPQLKIVSAEISLSTSDWVIKTPLADTVSRQSFHLKTTVSFIPMSNQDSTEYVPPAPPVLFQVPSDIFYPFQSSAASSNNVHISLFLSASVISIVVSLLL